MKLVINTQIRENYGAHDWDGEGACPQYWKCKGGETYVVPNLSAANVMKITKDGIPTLTNLIESRSHSFEEYIVGWDIVEDDAPAGEEWETPYTFAYVKGKWVANRVIKNDEYGYMHRDVESKVEEYDMLPGGERANYRAMYKMRNGDNVKHNEVDKYLAKMEKAA